MSDKGTLCDGRLIITSADYDMGLSQWVSAQHVATESGDAPPCSPRDAATP
jgi:hypothetical protein